MSAMSLAIDQALKAPQKEYSKKEAQELLRKYGVLTTKNNISKAYSDIFVKIEKRGDNEDESK